MATPMTPKSTPVRLHLKREEGLEIDWQDGHQCVYTLGYLRAMCPCAACRVVREGSGAADSTAPGTTAGGGTPVKKKPLLTILPGNYAAPLKAVAAERVGNYALRIEWSDNHASGIYSFDYLREICPTDRPAKA
jgi:DUF971 family protein